jgi:hypothetical protein
MQSYWQNEESGNKITGGKCKVWYGQKSKEVVLDLKKYSKSRELLVVC